MLENTRLYYIKSHQQNLRLSTVTNLSNAFGGGQNDSSLIGNRVVLPSSFTGGPRYMQQNYLDAITLCKHYGYPDLFITVTCNPKWPELCRHLETISLNGEDRPDLMTRVFKIKLDHLISAIKDEHILGRTMGVVYTIEFQKRGLPHAHICIFFHKDDKLPEPTDIDRIISAELPDKAIDQELFHLVSKFMIHGPCGKDNPKCPCTKKNVCTKGFPKAFNNQTYVDGFGYPVYRRRDTGITVEKNGVTLDNRHVVGYNPILLKRYQSHINVEWCNQIGSIKYLFKYINKGPDRITVGFSHSNKHSSSSASNKKSSEDEVQNYFDCRYVSACEAAWRLFGYDIHYQTPTVERLSFHLKGQQPIVYNPGDNLEEILSKLSVGTSQFLEWMECNKSNERARQLTYEQFPQHFVWNKSSRKWTERKKGYAIGRLNFVPPRAGEVYFLRILLAKVKGPTSYEKIKTVDNFEHKTCRDACYALGLLDDDKEYIECIKETSQWANGSYCRSLFVTLITSDSLSRPEYVWEQTWQSLCDDIQHIRRQELHMPDLILEDDAIKNIALAKIEEMLKGYSMTLKNIPNMPYPDYNFIHDSCNNLLQDEMSYDIDMLKVEHDHLYPLMNQHQKNAYHQIKSAVIEGKGGVFFVYGYGGTGKTFLWKTLSAGLRADSRIVLNVASSGIAALLLDGGRTAHSRFAIPFKVNEDSFCTIAADSNLAGLLKQTDLIIWDEAPMMHRHCFEALDRTLKDLASQHYKDQPFGGKVVVFGGDFRQILPIIQKGRRQDVVNASLNSSYIWKFCTVLKLTENMRLQSGSKDEIESTKQFAEWILNIGEGNLGGPNDGEAEITFPDEFLIDSQDDHINTITTCIYPDINDHLFDPDYFQDRAILVPTNEEVDNINDYMISRLNTDEVSYFSSDSVCEGELSDQFEESLYTPELLNSLKVSGCPHHKLTLKIGVPIMLIRNIDQSKGLCNGTRLQVTRLGEHVIEALVISGKNVGDLTYIPRMKIIPSDTNVPFKFQRRQFPVMVCFGVTINKSQGQSLKQVGLFLRHRVFSHGQLYVAVSRVTSKKGLKVLICDSDGNTTNKTTNVVYKEVLQKIS